MQAAQMNVRFEGNNGHDADIAGMSVYDPFRTLLANNTRL